MPRRGKEWIVDASGCDAARLRDVSCLRAFLETSLSALSLRPVAPPLWHVFPGEAGVTGMVLLAESHLTLHTFPEHGTLALNLYCCRERDPFDWTRALADSVGAERVLVRVLERGGEP